MRFSKCWGIDHEIMVEFLNNSDVANVTCYLNRAKTGGIKEGVRFGRGYPPPDGAMSCQPGWPITLSVSDKIKKSDDGDTGGVLKGARHLVFKKLKVILVSVILVSMMRNTTMRNTTPCVCLDVLLSFCQRFFQKNTLSMTADYSLGKARVKG
ncbi:MAG: CreA family protein [Symbiopectobacterium sp.]